MLLRLCLLPALAAPALAPSPVHANAVSPWVKTHLDVVAASQANPARAARAFALVDLAISRASRRTNGDRAAIAAAAHTTLVYLWPQERERFDRVLPARSSRSGHRHGLRAAAAAIQRAQSDGSGAPFSGQRPAQNYGWVPTPPSFAAPLEPLAGTWRPYYLSAGDQLRPGPPRISASELREVATVGRQPTPRRRRIALLWADGVGTSTPAGHWRGIALRHSRRLGTERAARLFAVLGTASADAFTACFDAKYAYWSERPISAITRSDPVWQPFLPTPPHPSYPSGHACVSGAASVVLGHHFPRERAQLRRLAEQAARSRVYAGIHFRSDSEVGLRLGRAVGRLALR